MRFFNLATTAFFLSFSLIVNVLHSQDKELRTSVADLSQDVRALSQQLRSIQFELDLLKEKQVANASDPSIELLSKKIKQIEQAVNTVRIEMAQRDKALGDAILEKVSDVLNEYVHSLNHSASAPSILDSSAQSQFSDNYPKTGLSYEVQSGDTLSQIALKFGSTVQYIQDANQIKDPTRDLRVGDTIFIPLKEN